MICSFGFDEKAFEVSVPRDISRDICQCATITGIWVECCVKDQLLCTTRYASVFQPTALSWPVAQYPVPSTQRPDPRRMLSFPFSSLMSGDLLGSINSLGSAHYDVFQAFVFEYTRGFMCSTSRNIDCERSTTLSERWYAMCRQQLSHVCVNVKPALRNSLVWSFGRLVN